MDIEEMTICITGTLSKTRDTYLNLIRKAGGNTQNSITTQVKHNTCISPQGHASSNGPRCIQHQKTQTSNETKHPNPR